MNGSFCTWIVVAFFVSVVYHVYESDHIRYNMHFQEIASKCLISPEIGFLDELSQGKHVVRCLL